MASNTKDAVKQRMIEYSTMWNAIHPNISQTRLFREIVPIDATDFTTAFTGANLQHIFTGERLRTAAGFNCNHLYRDIRTEADILVYSDDRNTVLHPLGEPGRDVDKAKIGHMMVMSHADEGPVDFNLMLPSTMAEVTDLGGRLDTAVTAIAHMRENSPLSLCGPKVIAKAVRMKVPLDTGIQEFFMTQITTMDESIRAGPPGYKLNLESGEEIGANPDSVTQYIKEVFGPEGSELTPKLFIQSPDRNTQILSHIHIFMLNEKEALPETVGSNYVDVELILEVKNEFVEDVPLVRTRTPPPPIAQIKEEEEEGAGLSRQSSVAHFNS